MAQDGEPLVRLRLLGRDLVAYTVDEDLAAAAGDRVEPGVTQSRDRLPQRQLAAARDVLHLRRRQRVQVDLVTRLDRAEEILVVVDVEVGMMSALHQQAGAAERECLLDLLEDDRLRQEVALARVAGTAVEGAELAVRVADVRVVEVPVDDEGDPRRVGLAVADLVRSTADRDEVARLQQGQRLVVRDALAVERPLEDRRDRAHATTASRTKRSSGTSSSSP